jgi:hypothetical protein
MIFRLIALVCALTLGGCTQKANEAEPSKSSALGGAPAITAVAKAVAPPRKYDGPFGLQGGLGIADVRQSVPDLVVNEETPMWYSASSVPTPHPSFESYQLQFAEKSGLCALVGIGKDIPTGDSGAEVKLAFDSLTSALSERYGKGKRYDFFSGAGSGSAEYWMMYLNQKDQTLAMTWDKSTGANLPPSISNILVQAHATDTNTGFVNLRYEFANMSDCADQEKAEKDKAL